MNRGLERAAVLLGILVFLGSVQFGACLLGGLPALLAAPLLGAGGTMIWFHFDLPQKKVWLVPLVLGLTSLCGVLIVELSLSRNLAEWFCAPCVAVASALTLSVVLRSRLRCNLCNRRIGSQDVIFRCPRCSMQVCDETCWSFEHRRCALCLEQRVPVLPMLESWWMRVAGPRSRQGRCQVCLGSAETLDLRACPHCRRPQCRGCWDFNNGECARCAGALPDLPPSLIMATAQISEGQ